MLENGNWINHIVSCMLIIAACGLGVYLWGNDQGNLFGWMIIGGLILYAILRMIYTSHATK